MAETKAFGQFTIVDLTDSPGGVTNLIRNTKKMPFNDTEWPWVVEPKSFADSAIVPLLINNSFQALTVNSDYTIKTPSIQIFPDMEKKILCFSCYVSIGENYPTNSSITLSCNFTNYFQDEEGETNVNNFIYSEPFDIFKNGIFQSNLDNTSLSLNSICRIYLLIDENFFSRANKAHETAHPSEENEVEKSLLITFQSSGDFTFFAAKLECDEVPTQWSPHPEDVEIDLTKNLAALEMELTDKLTTGLDGVSESISFITASVNKINNETLVAIQNELASKQQSIENLTEEELNALLEKFDLQDAVKVNQLYNGEGNLSYLSSNSILGLQQALKSIQNKIFELETTQDQWFSFDPEAGLIIGKKDEDGNVADELLQATNEELSVSKVSVRDYIRFGDWAWIPEGDGTEVSLIYMPQEKAGEN